MNNTEENVTISREEYEVLQAAKAAQERKSVREKRKGDLQTLEELENTAVTELRPILLNLAGVIKANKKKALDTCKKYLELRSELYPRKADSNSCTMLSGDKKTQIKLITNYVRRYKEGANIGVDMIKDYVKSLVGKNQQEVVDLILSFLKTDNQGNLQAYLMQELEAWAKMHTNDKLLEAVEIIKENSYITTTTTSLRLFIKNEESGALEIVPLSMTSNEA